MSGRCVIIEFLCVCFNKVFRVPFEYASQQQQESCKIDFSGLCIVNICSVIFLSRANE